MNVARFSVSRPVAVTMRIAALVLLGIICLMRLPIDLLPKVEIPTIAVNTSWPNVAPEEMEAQITRPIEQAVSTVPGLKYVTSSSNLGSSSVRVQLEYGTDLDSAASDVLQFVQRARRSFPNDPNIGASTVFKFDPSTSPILVYGVSGIDDPIRLRTLLQNEVSPIIEAAGGVAQVTIAGGRERAILIDVDPDRLRAAGLGLDDVIERVQAENIALPAGIAREGTTEYTIRSEGYFRSVEEAKALPLTSYDGSLVTLGSVADVRDSAQEERIITRMDGEGAVSLSVTKQGAANTVETSEAIKEKISEIQKRYPELKFGLAYDQSQFVEKSIDELKETAMIGGVLAIIVITFFLRNLRSTLVVALSIPISIVSTFALMYFCGFTLNTISLSGLALATGLIVDDAIVVLENIFRHMERDKKRAAEAAVTGTQEIMGAVVASTITVMVVFLPLLLIKGQAGQTFTQFALVVIFSIAISLLDATTVVPMLCSRVIKEKEILALEHPEERGDGKVTLFDRLGKAFHKMDEAYRGSLRWALKRRWLVLGGAIASVAIVVPLIPLVGTETLPQTDTGDFSVRVRLPIGTALSVTKDRMDRVEKILLADKEVQTVLVAIGTNLSIRGTTGQASSYQGSATVRLKADRKSRTEDVIKRVQKSLASIPGIRATATPYDLVANILGGQNQGVEVNIFGQDLALLGDLTKKVREAMADVPGLDGVDQAADDAAPQISWKVDREKARLLGVSYRDLASAVGTATNGQLAGYYQEAGYQYPIYVQSPVDRRRTLDDLKQLPINISGTNGGAARTITLGQVAQPVVGVGPSQIDRLNRQRYVSVSGRVTDRAESDVQNDVRVALNKLEFPNGTYWDFGVRQKQKAEEFSGLGVSVFLAIALIYMLLASQFESFVYPLIVLCSVPLAIIGVVLALFLTDRSFGLTAFVGILMLIGIAVKNGILLVDYTNHLRGEGQKRDEAILNAGPTRLRPILMTSLCAIFGMLPLALGIGASSELQAPLATAVVGGLFSSTFMTLYVVPVVYTMFDDLARRFRKDERDLAPPKDIGPTPEAVGASVR
ncbi:efflux RND transporter permease subunit [bacterium]|nr:MAG: efflux RND transporter permease subunit [bacterium]